LIGHSEEGPVSTESTPIKNKETLPPTAAGIKVTDLGNGPVPHFHPTSN